jgi:hypothetical protein
VLELLLPDVSDPNKQFSAIVNKPNPTFSYLQREIMEQFKYALSQRYTQQQIQNIRPIFKTEDGKVIIDESKFSHFIMGLNMKHSMIGNSGQKKVSLLVELV